MYWPTKDLRGNHSDYPLLSLVKYRWFGSMTLVHLFFGRIDISPWPHICFCGFIDLCGANSLSVCLVAGIWGWLWGRIKTALNCWTVCKLNGNGSLKRVKPIHWGIHARIWNANLCQETINVWGQQPQTASLIWWSQPCRCFSWSSRKDCKCPLVMSCQIRNTKDVTIWKYSFFTVHVRFVHLITTLYLPYACNALVSLVLWTL